MKATARSTLFVLLYTVAIVLANSGAVSAANLTPESQAPACIEIPNAPSATPQAAPEAAEVATAEPPGRVPVDANWPIVSSSRSIQRAGDGKSFEVVTTVRKAPPSTAKTDTGTAGGKLASVAAITCGSASGYGVTIDSCYPGCGSSPVFSQHFHSLYNRHDVCIGGHCVFGHVVTATEIWWTRSSSYYDLSSQSITWWMSAYNCSNVYDPRSTSNVGFYPTWSGNETYHYWYYGPMNGWPIEWSDTNMPYDSHISQGTDWTESGYWAGHLSGSITFSKI